MLWLCGHGCKREQPKSKGHPGICKRHGETYVYDKALGRGSSRALAQTSEHKGRRRAPMKRSEPKRDWTDANAKVELEARCRVCGYEGPGIERAHVMGRKYDQPAHTGTKTLYVNPLDIVPLCPVFAPEKCHQSYDDKQIDLLPFLAVEEQARAVEVAGGIEAARKRLAPSTFNAEIRELAA